MLDGKWARGVRGEGVKIVCIGWGSLVWDPGVLRCVGDWQTDGPTLPLEFARVSRDGRLTLVLTPGAEPVPTLWCELDYHTGEAAQAALAGREGAALHAIGLWPGHPPRHATGYAEIAQWGAGRGFGAVTWTALRPRFDGVDGAGPKDAAAAASYLGTLTGDALVRDRVDADRQQCALDELFFHQRTDCVQHGQGRHRCRRIADGGERNAHLQAEVPPSTAGHSRNRWRQAPTTTRPEDGRACAIAPDGRRP